MKWLAKLLFPENGNDKRRENKKGNLGLIKDFAM
jgi:hypothetical protein